MKVFLDTSFIVSCIKRKIDFLSELKLNGLEAIVPSEVFEELKDLSKSKKTSHEDRMSAKIGFDFLNSEKIKKVSLGSNVDEGLIKKGQLGLYIATLDNEIKRNVKNKVIISSSNNSIILQRD